MSNHMLWRRQVPWLRLLGLILLGVLLWRVDVPAVLGIIGHANRYLLMVAVILNLPMVLLKSLRWKALMQSQGIRYPVGKAYLAYFGSIFIGFLTPGRLGEFVKVIHINQDCEVPFGPAFSSVLADRLFDLYVLFLVGGGALLTLTVGNAEVIALAGLALVLTLPLVLFLNNTTFGWLHQIGHRLDLGGQQLFALGRWLVEMRMGLRQLTWSWLLVAIILTVLAYAIFFGQCYLLAMALQLPVGFVQTGFAVALGSLLTLFPISISGLGTREVAIVAYLSTVGVLPEAALGLSLLVFLTFYVGGGLMGTVAWWLKPVPLAILSPRSKPADFKHESM